MRKITDLLTDILTTHLKILTTRLEGFKIEDYNRGFEDGFQEASYRMGLDKLQWKHYSGN